MNKEELLKQGLTEEEINKILAFMNKKTFREKLNDKVKDTMNFIGFILSIFGGLGYLITIYMLVWGVGGLEFELFGKDGLFFIIGISFGILIRTGFFTQGIQYAKNDSKSVIDEYNSLKQVNVKEKKTQSFEFKMFISYATSTLTSVIWFFVFSVGVVYLAGFEGTHNPIYFGNAISNVLMFTGFGFLSLNSAYEKFITYKIPVLKERIRLIKNKSTQN